MKNNNYQYNFRRKMPWDEEEVSDIAPFVRDEYRSHYFYHHRSLSETEDSELLNKLIPQSFPYWRGKNIRKMVITHMVYRNINTLIARKILRLQKALYFKSISFKYPNRLNIY